MQVIREQSTPSSPTIAPTFLALHGEEPLHPGVIVIVPNVIPSQQYELFAAALKHVGTRDLTNTVVEVRFVKDKIQCSEYELPHSE
jgi:hypothetical protein